MRSPMNEWPLWEIFIRTQHGLAHRHVGSLHAPDAEMAIKNARDVYTRRNEGVSIWAVQLGRRRRVRAGRPGRAVRARQQQGLPASDVLSDARRSEASMSRRRALAPKAREHCALGGVSTRAPCLDVMATTAFRVPAAPRRLAADPRAAAGRMGRPRAGARGGHRAGQRRTRSPRPGARCGSRYAGEVEARFGPRAATRTSSRSCATPASFAICCWSSSRTATSPIRWRGSSCSTRGIVLLLRALAASRDARIAEIAAKAREGGAYHVERSGDWVIRLGDGTDESHARMQAAIDDLWMYTGEMFAPDADRARADRRGHRRRCARLARRRGGSMSTRCSAKRRWRRRTACSCSRGGKRGVHTEHLGHLLAEMQVLQRAYPGARW